MKTSPIPLLLDTKFNQLMTHLSLLKNYRLAHCHNKEIENDIEGLLESKIIRETYSPWPFPIWVVPEKIDASGKSYSLLLIYYRKLNSRTTNDKFPTPNITEIVEKPYISQLSI